MSASIGLAVALLIVCLCSTAISGGVFMAYYRYRRRMTRWMRIPVPFSAGMRVAVAVLAVSEAGVVAAVVLLVVGSRS